MPEWLIGAVLKTVEHASVPWVRIPVPPIFIFIKLVNDVLFLIYFQINSKCDNTFLIILSKNNIKLPKSFNLQTFQKFYLYSSNNFPD